LSGSVVRARARTRFAAAIAREKATKGNSPWTRRQRARARETVINIADNKGSLNQIVGPLAPGRMRACVNARAHVDGDVFTLLLRRENAVNFVP